MIFLIRNSHFDLYYLYSNTSADYLLYEELPETDVILLQALSEAKKYGSQQYQKYTRLLQALVGIVDRL